VRPVKPALGVLAVTLALALAVAGCGSSGSKAADEDFSAGTWVLNSTVAVASAVFGASTYGDDDTTDCDWGANSLNPIAVVNTYPQPMTFSITINPTLAGNLNFISAADGGGSLSGCNISNGNNGTFYVTTPAASGGTASFTIVGWILAGSGETGTNNLGQDNNLAIGAGGSQWYDFWLHVDVLNEGYENLELNYSNTGGTDPSQNVQTGLFNGLNCSANSAGNVSLATPNSLTTPFTSDNANAWTFEANQPLCFGFLQPNSATQS